MCSSEFLLWCWSWYIKKCEIPLVSISGNASSWQPLCQHILGTVKDGWLKEDGEEMNNRSRTASKITTAILRLQCRQKEMPVKTALSSQWPYKESATTNMSLKANTHDTHNRTEFQLFRLQTLLTMCWALCQMNMEQRIMTFYNNKQWSIDWTRQKIFFTLFKVADGCIA